MLGTMYMRHRRSTNNYTVHHRTSYVVELVNCGVAGAVKRKEEAKK